MPTGPGEIKYSAMTTEQLVTHLRREADALEALIQHPEAAGEQPKETPIAFVGSIAGPLVEWGLTMLPRSRGSHNQERVILHELHGLINGLTDIY